MKNGIVAFVFFIFLISPAMAQSNKEKKAKKKEQAAKEYDEIKKILDEGAYIFEAEWATSHNGRRISLISNPGTLKVEAPMMDAYFPFFGVAHSAGYGGNGGIEFKGEAENFEVEFNDKKQQALITFKSKNKMESFDISLTIFKNKSATLVVNSSKRSMMRYSGKISPLKEKG